MGSSRNGDGTGNGIGDRLDSDGDQVYGFLFSTALALKTAFAFAL